MKYNIEYQTKIGIGETVIEAQNESFARANFYEIYSRTIKIITIAIILNQAA